MKLTKVDQHIMFSLGYWIDETEKGLGKKGLELVISKSIFISALIRAKLAGKQRRALYKNLMNLEKKKLLSYKKRNLVLTKNGRKIYLSIKSSIMPYLRLISILEKKSPMSYTRNAQTKFKFS